MGWLYHLNAGITHGLEGFLETAVPMIAVVSGAKREKPLYQLSSAGICATGGQY